MVVRRIGKIAVVALAAMLVLVGAGALAFIPFGDGPEYRFRRVFGTSGEGPGQFDDPTGVAVTAERVFVADSRNGRIQVFDRQGTFLRAFGERGDEPGQFGRPMNLTVDGDKLYVPEYFNDRVQVFSLDGEPLTVLGGAGTGEELSARPRRAIGVPCHRPVVVPG